MSAKSADEYASKIKSAEDRVRSLQGEVTLGDVNSELGEIDTQIRNLPTAIQEMRARGYVFRNYLERKAEVLAQQLAELRPRIDQAMGENSRELRQQAEMLSRRVSTLHYGRNEVELASVDSALSDLESRIEASKDSMEAMYAPLKQNAQHATDQVREVAWVLDQMDGATFRLYVGEGVVSTVKAQLMTGDEEGPKGVFFLTDERVLFEQKDEIVTKKRLFIATEKQKVQELKWEAALGQIKLAKASERGGRILGIGKKELLELEFVGGAHVSDALLRLEADSDAWQALIGRAKSGDIAGERTVQKDKTVVEAARMAPTKCSTCGATITQPVVKGMTEIKCEYCGAIVRL